MKTSFVKSVVLPVLLLWAIPSAAQKTAIPLTLRAVSIAKEDLDRILPGGLCTEALDPTAMTRLEAEVQRGRAKVVGKWQKSVLSGEKEVFQQIKDFPDHGNTRNVGLMWEIVISLDHNGWGSANMVVRNVQAGTLDGPAEPKRDERLTCRFKGLTTSFDMRLGTNVLAAVVPATRTDGNRNLLLVIVSTAGSPPALNEGTPPSRSCFLAEVFAFPAGTPEPDVATLEKLRRNPNSKVSEIALNAMRQGQRCLGQSVTETRYFTGRASTEIRNIGVQLDAKALGAESEFSLQYSTLLAPYTCNDYKRAEASLGRLDAKQQDALKFRPRILGLHATGRVTTTGSPMIVPLRVVDGGDPKAPVYFALVSCVDSQKSPR